MNSGEIGAYKWYECVPSDTTTMFDAVRKLRHHLLGLRAVNVSWDSGLLVPSDAEKRQGWVIEAGRAVSPVIDDAIVEEWPWCDGGFEEWYFFSRLPTDLNLSPFCNRTGLSISDWASLVDVPGGFNLRDQLERARPDAVIGIGERLFSISANPILMRDFREAIGPDE